MQVFWNQRRPGHVDGGLMAYGASKGFWVLKIFPTIKGQLFEINELLCGGTNMDSNVEPGSNVGSTPSRGGSRATAPEHLRLIFQTLDFLERFNSQKLSEEERSEKTLEAPFCSPRCFVSFFCGSSSIIAPISSKSYQPSKFDMQFLKAVPEAAVEYQHSQTFIDHRPARCVATGLHPYWGGSLPKEATNCFQMHEAKICGSGSKPNEYLSGRFCP